MMKPLVFGALQAMSAGSMTGGGWRHPESKSTDFLDLDHWTSFGKKLDDAGIDFLFFADTYGYPLLNGEPPARMFEDAAMFPAADPLVVLSAIAAATKNIGLVVTITTMTEAPPHIARRLSTLDNLSKGRMGWNIVTGGNQGSTTRIFGTSLTPHDERYDMADDFVELTLKFLEGCWEDGALVNDRAKQIYVDPDKVREIEHEGPYFSAHGLLPVPPSAQRTPLIFQAGASPRGRRFAAKYAEAVFLPGGNVPKVAEDIAAIRDIAQNEFGRDPESIVFLCGALFVAAATMAEAERKREEILDLTTIETAILDYANHTGIDLTNADLTKPLELQNEYESQSTVQRYAANVDGPPTVGEMLEAHRRDGVNGLTFVGDPASIADEVEEFIGITGADGFLLEPFHTPGTYDDFIEFVLPALRERGLAKAGYTGDTLREHVFGEGKATLPDSHIGASYRASAENLT